MVVVYLEQQRHQHACNNGSQLQLRDCVAQSEYAKGPQSGTAYSWKARGMAVLMETRVRVGPPVALKQLGQDVHCRDIQERPAPRNSVSDRGPYADGRRELLGAYPAEKSSTRPVHICCGVWRFMCVTAKWVKRAQMGATHENNRSCCRTALRE